MGMNGNKDNPCLLGEIIRVLKDYLDISNYYMCDELEANDSKGDGSKFNINTISAWTTSKHEPSRNNCKKISELFIKEIKGIEDNEKIARLSAYLKYCIYESNVKELFKKEIIAITNIEELVRTLLNKAKSLNKSLEKPFVHIEDTIPEELEKYYTPINGDKSEDYSINITLKNTPNITLPPTKSQFLVGRDNLLAKLDQMGDKVLLINGLGGIGKTELCKAYFWKKYNDYGNIGWIDYNLGIKESIVNQVQTNMKFNEDISLDDKYKSILLYLCNLKSCLLIIDNINNTGDENLNDIARLPFRVIANSRLNCGNIFTSYALEVLDKESCKELFRKYYKNISVEDDIYIEKIVEISGYHTLTIELLAKQCKCSGLTVKELYGELTDHGLSLEGIKEHIKASINNDAEESKRLIEHLQKLFQIFKVEDDKEKYILSNLSVLPSLYISKKDIKEWLGLESLDEVNSLVDKGWINEKDGQVKMHEVISEVVRNSDIRPSLSGCVCLIVYFEDFLRYSFITGDPFEKSNYIIFGESILQYFDGNLIIADLANNIAEIYMEQGNYKKAEPLFKRALKITKQVFGDNHFETAYFINNLGKLYVYQCKYKEAVSLFKKAIKINSDNDNYLSNLASLYDIQGKYKEADLLYERALKIRKKALGIYRDKATSLENIAEIYFSQVKYEKAEPLYRRALEIREKEVGPNHTDTASSLNNLAFLYKNQGKYKEAEPLFKRALKIRKQVLKPNHPDTANSLHNLAELYYDQGKYKKAESLYKRALKIRENVLGNHIDTANSLERLAVLYDIQDKYEEAEPLYIRALEIREQVLGPNHLDTATSLNLLVELYNIQGYYESAEPLCKRALKIREEVLGNHLDTATSLENLAEIYFDQGKYEDEEHLYKRAIEIREQVFGPNHIGIANSLENLAQAYSDHGKYAEAEHLYKRASKIRKEHQK